jgi:hypothetical protein
MGEVMGEKVYCKIDKAPSQSKNNRIYGVIALIAFLATPQVYDFINGWLAKLELPGIPSGAVTVAIQVFCVLGYIVRTYYTTVCAPPGPDNPQVDVMLDEDGKPYPVVKGVME